MNGELLFDDLLLGPVDGRQVREILAAWSNVPYINVRESLPFAKIVVLRVDLDQVWPTSVSRDVPTGALDERGDRAGLVVDEQLLRHHRT